MIVSLAGVGFGESLKELRPAPALDGRQIAHLTRGGPTRSFRWTHFPYFARPSRRGFTVDPVRGVDRVHVGTNARGCRALDEMTGTLDSAGKNPTAAASSNKKQARR